jgi:flagellar biosynthesis protein FlhG
MAKKKRVVAVGGGKGGVGKSLVTANLAVTLAKQGADVIVLDADLGAPNLHSLFGIDQPKRSIEDFLDGRIADLTDVATDSGIQRVRLLCGAPGSLGAANPNYQSKQKLIRHLNRLQTDCLLIDVGAGVDFNTLDFFNASDIRLIVLTPEITSVQNAYGFLKSAVYRRMQRSVSGRKGASDLKDSFGGRAFEIGSTMAKMSTFLGLVDNQAPELSEAFRLLLEELNVSLVGNMLAKEADRKVIWAVQKMIEEFLELPIAVAGMFSVNPRARASVNSGRPFVLDSWRDADTLEFEKLARAILQKDLAPVQKLRSSIAAELSTDDHAITLGLEDIEFVEPGPAPQPQPPPPPTTEISAESDARHTDFLRELSQVKRLSDRFDVQHYVEVQLGGHWHLGTLVSINEAGACVAGIRAAGDWKQQGGALRVITSDEEDWSYPLVPVHLRSYDETTGRIVIQFTDPAFARSLVEHFGPV